MRNEPLRICLGDLRHETVNRHSVMVPIGIGYIGSYTRSILGESNVEIRLHSNADDLFKTIEEWNPHILGLSNYCWNNSLAMRSLRFARNVAPEMVLVVGGPEFPATDDDCAAYLQAHPYIDFYSYGEGETAFAPLARAILDGADTLALRRTPQPGMMALHPEHKRLVKGEEAPRLKDLDVIPSPYLSGMLDEFLDGRWSPSFEMARGCPYGCTYCVQGDSWWNKIARFGLERLKAELDYVAERLAPFPGILLGIYDSNFGMYREDEEIALHIRHLQDTKGWPNNIYVNTGKSQHHRILRVAEMLHNKMGVSCSVQSLNQNTLKVVKRRNLPDEDYRAMVAEVVRRGTIPNAEVIIPLPEESKETYFAGLQKIVEAGVRMISPYTTMLLKRSELASVESRRKYSMQTRFRILPLQFGEYRGEKCFEIEEVCVATNTMSFEDYIECRAFGFICTIFLEEPFTPIRRFIAQQGVDLFTWLKLVWNLVGERSSGLSGVYQQFIAATRSELFNSVEELEAFYTKPENYQALLNREHGENLMRKYRPMAFMEHLEDAIDVGMEASENYLKQHGQSSDPQEIAAFIEWMRKTRDVSQAFDDPSAWAQPTAVTLTHDLDAWYARDEAEAQPLRAFKAPGRYLLEPRDKKAESILAQQSLHGTDRTWLAARFFFDWPIQLVIKTCHAERLAKAG